MSTDYDLQTFLAISSLLTGYSEVELEGTTMLEDYFRALMQEHDQQGVREFLVKAQEAVELWKRAVAALQEILKLNSAPAAPTPPFDQMSYQGLGPRISLLWYLGSWTTMNGKESRSESDRTAILSDRAYQNALMWLTAETHPAGAKQPGYASWSEPPL